MQNLEKIKTEFHMYVFIIHLSFICIEGLDNPPFNVLHLAEHPYSTNHNVLILIQAKAKIAKVDQLKPI